MAATIQPTQENFFQSFNIKFEPHVRGHLKNVFASLAMCMLSASAGAYIHIFTSFPTNFLTNFTNFLILTLIGLGLALSPHGPGDTPLPMMLWFPFLYGFLPGVTGPLALALDIAESLMLVSLIYACFSGVARFAPNGKYLFLGGSLLSGLSTISFLGLLNFFFGSQFLFQVSIYPVLAIFCMVIMFHTKDRILMARGGDTDINEHNLGLWYMDFALLLLYKCILELYKSVFSVA